MKNGVTLRKKYHTRKNKSHLEKNHTWENGSHFEKWLKLGKKITVGKMGHIWKNNLDLKSESHLQNWVLSGKGIKLKENETDLKKIGSH